MATEILVFIPGTIGSELWDGDNRVWPGTTWEAIKGFSDARFQQLCKPALTARDIVRSAAGGFIAVYSSWIEAFESISRDGHRLFVEKPIGGATQTLYVFPYDWRVDLTVTSAKLADRLDAIVGKVADADLKLVCHSMGGVLARHYLESGAYTGRPAFARISLLVTFGTPHNGAAEAYAAATGLEKTTFLSIEQTRVLANDSRYPSVYQLFPSKTHSFIWDRDSKASYKDYPADAPEIVKKFGLTAAGLAAWTTFRSGLTGNRPSHIRYFFLVGSRQETMVRLLWTGTGLHPVKLDDSGDGTVSLPGAMDAATQSEFVGKSHVSLIETRPARETLAALFSATTLFSAQEMAATVTLAVRDLAVSTEDEIHVQIEFTPQIDHFKGALRFQRAVVPASGEAMATLTFEEMPAVPPKAIELTGAAFTYVTLKTGPIDIVGIYRPVLTQEGKPGEVVGPAFAVQAEA
jgi:phospholipase A1